MRKQTRTAAAVLAGLLAAWICVAENGPSDWRITVEGVRSAVIESAEMDEAREHDSHCVSREIESKGEVRTYRGMPFHMIVATADGPDDEHPYAFDQRRWEEGYDITLAASDGYAATFNTADVPYDALLLSVMQDGEPTAPSVVGDASKKLWVEDIVLIELDLGPVEDLAGAERQAFRLVLDLAGEEHLFSLTDLEQSPYYIEGRGSYTTSAGSTREGLYGGVKFADLLNRYISLKKDDTITVVAMDGYELSLSAEQILDEIDGVWILAFKKDGEYLDRDPGYIRTIKVGPVVPDIEGHNSVRMIEKIVFTGEPYRDFSLSMQGAMDFQVDRQTLQTGMSCHKRTVTFEWKGKTAVYTGIPLWRLLAFSDDPRFAPHKQNKAIISYQQEAARKGYQVELTASDGFTITLDSRELDGNDDVILAMYSEGEELPADAWPLILVWDREAPLVPKGAKPIKHVTAVRLIL